ncbi:hypothetical protein JHN45_25725, partial [Streptomyces sp. MBT53]|nr:hypothetical protein [Streptomyces sp. MBT53]
MLSQQLGEGRHGESVNPRVIDGTWHDAAIEMPTRHDALRYLAEAQWAGAARRMVAATGIAPPGTPGAPGGCRWIAPRDQDRQVLTVATQVREDGGVHNPYSVAARGGDSRARSLLDPAAVLLTSGSTALPGLALLRHAPDPGDGRRSSSVVVAHD